MELNRHGLNEATLNDVESVVGESSSRVLVFHEVAYSLGYVVVAQHEAPFVRRVVAFHSAPFGNWIAPVSHEAIFSAPDHVVCEHAS